MMMRRPLFILTLLVIASSAAAELTKYKDWIHSPEAYFLTDAERKEWLYVRTDEQAQVFIATFERKRGGMTFTEMVKHRAGIADRFFSVGDRKGSATIRGKMVILFGAPAEISTSRMLTRRDRYIPPPVPSRGITELGSMDTRHLTGGPRRGFWLVSMSFPAEKVPPFQGVDYTISIEVSAADYSEKVVKGISRRKLEDLFDAVIAASITRP